MIEFTPDALDRLLAEDDGLPLVTLHLLRFQPEGGRQKYMTFARRNAPIWDKYGAEVIFIGTGCTAVVNEPGQEWDAMFLSRYPSRQAFADMVRDPDYLAHAHLRTEALVETLVQPITESQRWATQELETDEPGAADPGDRSSAP